MLHVKTSKVSGTTLSGRARDHVVLTDRRTTGEEKELGCTSGALMLLSVGSCVVGNLNVFAMEQGIDIDDLSADVRVEDAPDNRFGAITVDVHIGGEIAEGVLEDLRQAAGSGRVTGRYKQNSEVRINISCTPLAQQAYTGLSARSLPSTSKKGL
jgi:uncharacterized OsmC-like protein